MTWTYQPPDENKEINPIEIYCQEGYLDAKTHFTKAFGSDASPEEILEKIDLKLLATIFYSAPEPIWNLPKRIRKEKQGGEPMGTANLRTFSQLRKDELEWWLTARLAGQSLQEKLAFQLAFNDPTNPEKTRRDARTFLNLIAVHHFTR